MSSLTRPQFVTGEIYHIVNRAIEGKNLFQEIADYFRFIFCLYELNNKKMVNMRACITRRKIQKQQKNTGQTCVNRDLLVEILAFCLMPNHYHLVVRQLTDNGISLFMKKLGDGYVGYFNEKYKRKGRGSIFQGHFKTVHIKTQKQFMNVICYVFTNPIELLEKTWKEKGVKNPQKAIKYLESYQWSSYLDCIGKNNFPSVTKRELLFEIFGNSKKLGKSVENWILYKAELNKGLKVSKGLFLE
ncbi:MAG: transposase [Minisyncoccales bacterium]